MAKRKPGEGAITVRGYVLHTFGSVGSWKDKKYLGAVRKLAHHIVAEKVLGRPLKDDEEVHHWNEIKTDNRNANLVVCPNRAYHMLLHQRTRAYDTCGHADWLRCAYCKTYDDPKNMNFRPRGKDRPGQLQWTHRKCASEYTKSRYVPRGKNRTHRTADARPADRAEIGAQPADVREGGEDARRTPRAARA